MKSTERLSPNFNERQDGKSVRFVIVHYTEMKDASTSLDHLCNPESKVSSHYLIDRSGELYTLVKEQYRAWHAGVSYWNGETDLNSASIGIELDHPGHKLGYTQFCAPQIDALKVLLRELFDKYNLPPSALLAHSDVAPLRKNDPGELFPWQELAQDGFGVWPTPQPEDYARVAEDERRKLLARFGYDCRTDDVYKATKIAFLRRYHPERLALGFDEESDARLRSLSASLTQTRRV